MKLLSMVLGMVVALVFLAHCGADAPGLAAPDAGECACQGPEGPPGPPGPQGPVGPAGFFNVTDGNGLILGKLIGTEGPGAVAYIDPVGLMWHRAADGSITSVPQVYFDGPNCTGKMYTTQLLMPSTVVAVADGYLKTLGAPQVNVAYQSIRQFSPTIQCINSSNTLVGATNVMPIAPTNPTTFPPFLVVPGN